MIAKQRLQQIKNNPKEFIFGTVIILVSIFVLGYAYGIDAKNNALYYQAEQASTAQASSEDASEDIDDENTNGEDTSENTNDENTNDNRFDVENFNTDSTDANDDFFFALIQPTATPTATQAPTPAPSASPSPSPTPSPTPVPNDEDLVRVLDYIPSIAIDLKYATEDNFTGTVIYDFSDALLRYGTVKKLAAAQEALLAQGYSLKIWDAYRPVSAQFALWDVCPDATYVANPNTGASSHSKGSAVDVTLVYADGTEVLMPTGFDDFSTLADRDYSDASAEAAANALLLETTMTAYGFTGYFGEWWHYADSIVYPVVVEE